MATCLFHAPAMAQDSASAADDQSAQASHGGIEEIVVTAQRREQNLQDVPVAVTAVTASTIEGNRIQNVNDLSSIAPNLSVREGAGGSKLPQYSLRGIYTYGSAIGADKGVSLYIDGVYIQSVVGSILDFADIERIEVLRGPQGTLFGRNATGGAISVTTRKPTGVLGFRQDATIGNFNQLRTKTRVDLPRIGPFAITASYMHSERDGDTRNLGAGTQVDFGPATNGAKGVYTAPRRLGDENNEGVFVAVDADFDPDLKVSYKFDYAQSDYTAGATGLSYLAGPSALQYGGTPPSLAGYSFYNASPNPMTPISLTRPDAVNNAYSLGGMTKSQGHNLTLEWSATDNLTLKNIAAYRTSETTNTLTQLDGLGGLQLPATSGGFPFVFVLNNSSNDDRTFTNEFQLNYSTDRVNVTAGLLYFDYHQVAGGAPNLYNVLSGSPVIGQNTSSFPTPFVLPRNTGYVPSEVDVTSKAAYAQGEFHLTDALSVVGGIRFTQDKKSGRETVPGSVAMPSNGASVPIRYKDDRVTYLIGVNYKPTDDILAYAKYSTGYISGGQLATITFEPETASSLEAGVKADLFDRMLRTNVALFHVDYKNIQVATLGSLTGIPSAANFGQAIIPFADSRAYGFEFESTLVPMDGLTLTANVGYTDFDWKKDTIFAGLLNGAGAPGVKEFFRPKWTGSTSAQYKFYDVVGGGDLVFRADLNYKSKTRLSNDITPGSGPTAQADPAYVKGVTGQEQFILNGRIALTQVPIGPLKGEVAVWGRNLLDDDSIVQATGLGFAVAVIYERQRTYGLDFSIQF
ncbi:TonB-dependent receptor [Novosphingobium pentaromativorans]|uniref:TonB-dependent receptor n=2 Tax=Novosphingobium pentaromativorans TaxID=205844 RepID=G6EAU4_9SPHN|nr:TonB-dependent receptor [Novosphingobium pentaromativorans]EHJ61731.1 hypothetical protein NSU_1492 [Novosphingobium pentaromativorans US6-1]